MKYRRIYQTLEQYGAKITYDGSGWRLLLEEEREFPAEEHVHLYFNLPADRFSAPFWGGAAPEELSFDPSGALTTPIEA